MDVSPGLRAGLCFFAALTGLALLAYAAHTAFGLGWRPDPVWLLLGGGLALTAVADGLYLVQSATDRYVQGTLLDIGWPASTLLVAGAAWQPARRKITIQDWSIVAVPVGCGLVVVQLLVCDHFERVNAVAVSLAAWALLLALARMALAFLENQRALDLTHTEARTDSLSGLRNRRSLLADLELQLERPGASPATLSGRVELHAPPSADRRAHPARRAGAAAGLTAGALQPRALGRRRLPGRPECERDPARSPRCGRLRRLRRHDHRAPVPAPIAEDEAIAELRRCARTQFDPMVVEAFCRVIARE